MNFIWAIISVVTRPRRLSNIETIVCRAQIQDFRRDAALVCWWSPSPGPPRPRRPPPSPEWLASPDSSRSFVSDTSRRQPTSRYSHALWPFCGCPVCRQWHRHTRHHASPWWTKSKSFLYILCISVKEIEPKLAYLSLSFVSFNISLYISNARKQNVKIWLLLALLMVCNVICTSTAWILYKLKIFKHTYQEAQFRPVMDEISICVNRVRFT